MVERYCAEADRHIQYRYRHVRREGVKEGEGDTRGDKEEFEGRLANRKEGETKHARKKGKEEKEEERKEDIFRRHG